MNDARISRGMKTQLAARAERLQMGDSSLGWKVGFGAPAVMEKLGIRSPLLGHLCASARVPVNGSVALNSFTRAVVEPEIAVHLGADLGPHTDENTIRAAIAGLGPAIELADLNFPPDDVERILAGNIFQHGVILGPVDTGRAGADLGGLSARLLKNGRQIAETRDLEANTGRIVDIVAVVADGLAEAGLTLRAGDVVIAGSVVPPAFVDDPCVISFRLAPFDEIAVSFT